MTGRPALAVAQAFHYNPPVTKHVIRFIPREFFTYEQH